MTKKNTTSKKLKENKSSKIKMLELQKLTEKLLCKKLDEIPTLTTEQIKDLVERGISPPGVSGCPEEFLEELNERYKI